MNWLSYVLKNWKSIKFRYSIVANEIPGRTWSTIQTNVPYLSGNKLFIPNNIWTYAGYINLKTHKIVKNENITVVGQYNLKALWDELVNAENNMSKN